MRITRLLRTVKARPRTPIGTTEYRNEDGRWLEYRKTARGWVPTGAVMALGVSALAFGGA